MDFENSLAIEIYDHYSYPPDEEWKTSVCTWVYLNYVPKQKWVLPNMLWKAYPEVRMKSD
jgi:hypothetical protein